MSSVLKKFNFFRLSVEWCTAVENRRGLSYKDSVSLMLYCFFLLFISFFVKRLNALYFSRLNAFGNFLSFLLHMFFFNLLKQFLPPPPPVFATFVGKTEFMSGKKRDLTQTRFSSRSLSQDVHSPRGGGGGGR